MIISYRKKIEALFDLYEEEHLTEKEIFERSIELAKDNNLDRDFLFDLNDTILARGYSFQFDIDDIKKKEFNSSDYWNIANNASKEEK